MDFLDVFSVRGDGGVLDVPKTPEDGFSLSRPVPTAGFDSQGGTPFRRKGPSADSLAWGPAPVIAESRPGAGG
jgi:hypothetical protein